MSVIGELYPDIVFIEHLIDFIIKSEQREVDNVLEKLEEMGRPERVDLVVRDWREQDIARGYNRDDSDLKMCVYNWGALKGDLVGASTMQFTTQNYLNDLFGYINSFKTENNMIRNYKS